MCKEVEHITDNVLAMSQCSFSDVLCFQFVLAAKKENENIRKTINEHHAGHFCSLNFVSSQIQMNICLNDNNTNKFLKGLFYRSKLFLNEDLT